MRHLISATVLALAACSPPAAPPEAPPTPAVEAAPAPQRAPQADSPTVGGDGSPIRLNPISADEVRKADLPGELGCSFAAGSGPLLIASGDVASQEPAFGIVKVGDYVERVAARGGFNGMVGGAAFSGRGKTVVVALTGPPTASGESPPSPAILTYERADGASRAIQGEWTCGP